MEQRPNAKLTPKGRETFVSRIESSLGVAEAPAPPAFFGGAGPIRPRRKEEALSD